MKSFAFFVLGIITVLTVNATFETDMTVHYKQQDRLVVYMENPNTDGRTKRVAYEVYVDRIFRGVISNEVVYATNEVDTGNAVIKVENIANRP